MLGKTVFPQCVRKGSVIKQIVGNLKVYISDLLLTNVVINVAVATKELE